MAMLPVIYGGSVDVAMLDADTYMSTVPVLEFLSPLLADPVEFIEPRMVAR